MQQSHKLNLKHPFYKPNMLLTFAMLCLFQILVLGFSSMYIVILNMNDGYEYTRISSIAKFLPQQYVCLT